MPAKHHVPGMLLWRHWPALFTTDVYKNNKENTNIIQTINLPIKNIKYILLDKYILYRNTTKQSTASS